MNGDIDFDRYHSVEIEFSEGLFPSVSFLCSAPEGARCRQCFNCDCEDHHSSECDEAGTRELVDIGECNVRLWVEAESASECGTGKVTLPVTTEWDGSTFTWSLAAEATP